MDKKEWESFFKILREIDKVRKVGIMKMAYICSPQIAEVLNLIINKELNGKLTRRKKKRKYKNYVDAFDVYSAISHMIMDEDKEKLNKYLIEPLMIFLIELKDFIISYKNNNNNQGKSTDSLLVRPPPYNFCSHVYPPISDINHNHVEPNAPLEHVVA